MTDRLDLPDRYRSQVEALLAEHVPEAEVWAYGSRVNGQSHDASNLDLVLRGPNLERIPADQLADLADALEESNIPILVQAHDWARLPTTFHAEIKGEYVEIQKGSSSRFLNWNTRRLGDCAELIRETVDPKSTPDLPYIGLEHIGQGTLTLTGIGKASDVDSSKSRYRKGDILFGKLRPYFRKVVLAPTDGICSTDIWVIRAKKGIDQTFLYYSMASESLVEFATAGSVGTRMPRAKWDHASQFNLQVPSMEEQRHIASVLGILDSAIEVNRQMSETLEQTAQALFKAWFINFDPIRAKADGRETILSTHLSDLFPDKFVDSELGAIPSEWHVGTLGDIAQEVRVTIQPEDIEPQAAYIALEHMPRNHIALSEWSTADEIASGKLVFESGQILFGRLRPYFHKVGVASVDGVCSTDIIVVSPMVPAWFGLVLGHMSSSRLVDYASAVTTGTRMPRASWRAISPYRIAIPPLEIAEAYNELVSLYIDQIHVGIHESLCLSRIRDTALPYLLSEHADTPLHQPVVPC